MASRRGKTRKPKTASASRASVTFPPELYQTLEQIARQKKVSVAWVVRDAAEKYVEGQWPLFGQSHEART
jgi:metal-responsive CopG/Arc/MetJ family transcriptional regulator